MGEDTSKKNQAKRLEERRLLKLKIQELEKRLIENQDEIRNLQEELDECDEELKIKK